MGKIEINYFSYIEDDLIDIFKNGKVIIHEERELGNLFCFQRDEYNVLMFLQVVTIEYLLYSSLSFADNSPKLFDFTIEHTVYDATRTKSEQGSEDYLTIIRQENLANTKIYFKPNYSVELPQLWLSKKNTVSSETHTMSYDFAQLEELLGLSKSTDQAGNNTFKAYNNNGFTFSMTINPQALSCSLELCYEKYTRPVYTVSFSGALEINIHGTNIVIKGQYNDVVVTIFTEQNFAMSELKGSIWAQ